MSFYADTLYPPMLRLVSGQFDRQRRRLLEDAEGTVLELGVGTGANLGFYPDAVTDVVGIDPHDAVLDRARDAAARLARDGRPYSVRLHRASAEQLPYDDGSFDAVVAFFTLCTIPDYETAARESFRVLRPGGAMLVYEHVKADDGSRLERWQRRLDPLWTRVAVGCHLDRDVGEALRAAGFEGELERFRVRDLFPPTSPRVRGRLVKPAA